MDNNHTNCNTSIQSDLTPRSTHSQDLHHHPHQHHHHHIPKQTSILNTQTGIALYADVPTLEVPKLKAVKMLS